MYSELLLRAGVEKNNSTAIYNRSEVKEELELSLDGSEQNEDKKEMLASSIPRVEVIQEEGEKVQSDGEESDEQEEFVEKEHKRTGMRPSFYLN